MQCQFDIKPIKCLYSAVHFFFTRIVVSINIASYCKLTLNDLRTSKLLMYVCVTDSLFLYILTLLRLSILCRVGVLSIWSRRSLYINTLLRLSILCRVGVLSIWSRRSLYINPLLCLSILCRVGVRSIWSQQSLFV